MNHYIRDTHTHIPTHTIYKHTYTHTYIHTHTYTINKHTYIHTHTYTDSCFNVRSSCLGRGSSKANKLTRVTENTETDKH